MQDMGRLFELLWKVTEHPIVYAALIGLVTLLYGLYTFLRKDNRSRVKNLWAMLEQRPNPSGDGYETWFILRAEPYTTLTELFPGDWWLRWRLRRSGSGRRLTGFRDVDFIPISPHKHRFVKELRSFLSGKPPSGWFDKACELAGRTVDKVFGLLTCEQVHISDKCFRNILMHPDMAAGLPKVDPKGVKYEEPNHDELLTALVRWATIHYGPSGNAKFDKARKLIDLAEIEMT